MPKSKTINDYVTASQVREIVHEEIQEEISEVRREMSQMHDDLSEKIEWVRTTLDKFVKLYIDTQDELREANSSWK